MKKILFLCTGNYYRSRFAEHLFNHLAQKQGLNWQADSRGLALQQGVNVGPISKYTIAFLNELGITVSENERFPLQASDADFANADKIIAVDESEHRPLMGDRYPQWEAAVNYWLIHDLNMTPASNALPAIAQKIQQLVTEIQDQYKSQYAKIIETPDLLQSNRSPTKTYALTLYVGWAMPTVQYICLRNHLRKSWPTLNLHQFLSTKAMP